MIVGKRRPVVCVALLDCIVQNTINFQFQAVLHTNGDSGKFQI